MKFWIWFGLVIGNMAGAVFNAYMIGGKNLASFTFSACVMLWLMLLGDKIND